MEPTIGLEINLLAHKFRQAVKKECENKGIPSSYFHVLRVLGLEDKTYTQKDICDCLHYKASSISVTISNMEKDELIKREKSKNDGREVIVKITKKGKDYESQIKDVFMNIENSLIDCLTLNELDEFNQIINKLLDSLERR